MKWEGKIKSLITLLLVLWVAQTQSLRGATIESLGLKWAKTGGSFQGSCAMVDLAVDNTGASYVLADFFDNSEFGGMSFSTRGSYVVKQDADGNVLWKSKLSGDTLTQLKAREIEISPDGNIIVAGYYMGTGTIAGQPVQPIFAPGIGNSLADFFLLKLRPDASVEWLVTEDMNEDLSPFYQDILTLDPAGNIYTHTRYFIDVALGGEAFAVPMPAGRGFLYAKYNSNGTLQWCRSLPHYGRFAFGPGSEMYFAYEFSSTHQWGAQIFTTTGGTNVILSRLNGDGSAAWALQGGGTGRDTIDSMAVDESGNVYLSGEASHTVEFGGVTYPAGTFGGAYIVSYDSSGSFRWLKAIQGPDNEACKELKVGPTGKIHVLASMPQGMTSLDGEVLAATTAREMAVLTFSGAGDLLSVARTLPYGFAYAIALGVGPDDRPVLAGQTVGERLDGIALQQFSSFSFFTAKVGSRRAPTITKHPFSLMLPVGADAFFSAEFDASAPYKLYWKKNSETPVQVDYPEILIEDVYYSNGGNYYLVVSNSVAKVESNAGNLWVVPPPSILQGPAATNLLSGETLRLGITAASSQVYDIQWYLNSAPINGAIMPELVISNVTAAHEGTYSVMVSNAFGYDIESAAVKVNFIPIASHRDMIHDPLQNMLYITSGNLLNRFNVTNKSFVSAIGMLGQVYGMDISEDFRVLALANTRTIGLTSYVFTITLETDIKTNAIQLVRTNGATGIGTRSVAFGHGHNLVATLDADAMPAFWADAETRQSFMFGTNYHSAITVSSADRANQAVVSTKTSPGQFFMAHADNRTVSAQINDVGLSGINAAVSRDGQHTLICRTAKVLDASGGLVATLPGPGIPLGAVYHPQSNFVYCTWSDTAEIRVFETAGYTQVGTFPIGTTLSYFGTPYPYAPGHLRISVDGNQIFCSVPDGIRIVALPLSPPVVVKSPLDQTRPAGASVTFTAQATLTPGLAYQWQKNGQDILDATNSTYTISVIQPDDQTGFRVRVSNAVGFNYSKTAYLEVLKGVPSITWADPAAIVYGTVLGASQLNATAGTAGTFIYDPPAGTKLAVGDNHRLQVLFVPDDSESFETVTNAVFINVQKKLLTFTTANTSRQYGLPNPEFALTVAGFALGDSITDLDVLPVISSSAGDASAPGTYPITISGGADNNYLFAYGSATLTVTKRAVAITLGSLSQAYNGTPRPVSATTVPEGVALNIKYNNQTTVPTAIGSYAISATPTDTVNYQGTATGTLVIFKGGAEVTWNPSPVTYGTALSSVQLNASSPVAAIFSYSPASGTMLSAGQHTLSVIVTPLDANYTRSTNTVTLEVNQKALTVTLTGATRAYGSANPALSGSLSGLVAGDNITATYSSTAGLASPVGIYVISPVFTDPGNRLANYSVQTSGGDLTVTKAPLTIKANDASRSYGAGVTYTAQFTGLKNDDVVPVTLSSTATEGSAPGTYPITVALSDETGLPTSNYAVTLQGGVLTVTGDPDQIIVFTETVAPYAEGSGWRILDPLALVTNVYEMSGAVLKLQVVDGKAYEDLQILSEGNEAGQIDVVGNTVRESGVPIASFSGAATSGGLFEIEFGASATMAQATKVLRRLAYNNTSGNPNPTSRSIKAELADINGGISDPAYRDFSITLRNDPPVVTWVLPGAESTLKASHPITLEVNVTDVDNTVSKVEFWVDDQKVGERATTPYRHIWTSTSVGTPLFKAIAFDAADGLTESSPPGAPYVLVPAISAPRFALGSTTEFRLDFIGVNGVEYDIEISSDLVVWTKLTTITAQSGGVPVIDPATLGVNQRFYRFVPKL